MYKPGCSGKFKPKGTDILTKLASYASFPMVLAEYKVYGCFTA